MPAELALNVIINLSDIAKSEKPVSLPQALETIIIIAYKAVLCYYHISQKSAQFHSFPLTNIHSLKYSSNLFQSNFVGFFFHFRFSGCSDALPCYPIQDQSSLLLDLHISQHVLDVYNTLFGFLGA